MRNKIPLEERFFAKVIVGGGGDDCWAWAASKSEHGYGKIHVDRKGYPQKAHRVSWALHNGPIPDGLDVLHSCDNPECTNPKHLFLGTHADNMADARDKGRWIGKGQGRSCGAGEAHGNARFTVKQINEIFRLRQQGLLQREIAAQMGTRQSYISQILSGSRWNSVAAPDYLRKGSFGIRMKSRRNRTDEAIARGDVAELLGLVEFSPCACLGSQDGEPLCVCQMTSQQVREAVSYAGLRRGKIVYLRKAARALE